MVSDFGTVIKKLYGRGVRSLLLVTGCLLLAGGTTLTAQPLCPVAALGYKYQKTITISGAKVSGSNTNFPVLIHITDNDLITNARNDGYDIIFSDQYYNKLNHELESYNPATGELIVWVQVPALSAGTDYQIFMIYGNPLITTPQSSQGTWDNNYAGVWHLNSTSYPDATVNANNGSSTNTTTAPGKISNGGNFVTPNDYIQIGTTNWSTSSGTVEAWAKTNGVLAGNRSFIFGHTVSGTTDFIQLYLESNLSLSLGLGINFALSTSFVTLTTGTWYHLVLTWDGTNYNVYVNGAIPPVGASGTYTGLSNKNTFADIGNDGNPTRNLGWNGIIDEVRVSKTIRSADWIKTEYNNQNDPATFYTIGIQTGCSVFSFSNTCAGSPVSYSVPITTGHTYTWTVIGGTPSSTTGNAITVTWASTGVHSIQLKEFGSCEGQSLTYGVLIDSDTEKPTFTSCPAPISLNLPSGQCNASVVVPDVTYNDNCAVTTLTWVMTGATTATSFTTGINQIGTRTFNNGVTTVNYIATDAAGNNSAPCSFTVTVVDDVPPLANCKPFIAILDLYLGIKNITWTDIDNGSTDNCGIISRTIDKATFTCSDIGANNVTLTVEDASGNKSTCIAVVTVIYPLPPNPGVTPATQYICNNGITNLLLSSNNFPSVTTWKWTVASPAQITGGKNDLTGTKTSIKDTLINSGDIAYKVVYTITPWLYDTCDLTPITAEVWVEPTPKAVISTTTATICSGSNVNVIIDSPTVTTTPASLSYVVSVTSTIPGNLGGTAATVDSPLLKAQLPYSITGTLTNSGNTPIVVTYTVIPKLNGCGDGPTRLVTVTVYPNNFVPVIVGCPSEISIQTGATCGQTATWTEPTALVGCLNTMTYTTRSHAPGAFFLVGNTPVTYTFINGPDTSTCTFNVIVRDNNAPVISGCPAEITVQTGAGRLTCNQTASWTEPTALDNCSGIMTYTTRSHAPGDIFPAGNTPVIYTFTDGSLNTSTCTFNVTVQDNTPPVITSCPTNIAVQTGAGKLTCNQIASWVEPTALDNCSGSVTYTTRSHAPGDIFPAGTTTVTYTFTDAKLNTSTCTFSVTVQDNTPPVITSCPTNIAVQTGAGRLTCNQIASWTEPTALDNCSGIMTYTTRSHAPGDIFPLGNTTVVYTFTDGSLNTTTCTFSVSVQDNTPPVIAGCPANISMANDAGNCSAVVTWTEPTATDNCSAPGSLVWTKSHSPGSTFPVGTTTVTYTVTDAINNVSNVCSFTVIVNDTEKPVITGCPGNITVPNDAGKTTAVVSWTAPAATDNCTPSVNLVWTISHAPGSTFPAGSTIVTYSVKDAANNVSNVCSFTVTVTDGEYPVITCPVSGQQNVTTNSGCTYLHNSTAWDATATDNYGVTSLTYNLTGVTTGTGTTLNNVIFNPGATIVTWTAKDAADNAVTCSYTVSVTDNVNPVINCHVSGQQNVVTNNACRYIHSGTTWDATATDNCSVSSLTYSLTGVTSGTGTTLNNVAFNEGVTTVTWTAVDAANYSGTCSYTVSVKDRQKPVVIGCPSNITLANYIGSCTRIVSWTEPTATDNCTSPGNLVWTKSHTPGSTFPVGTTTVSYTVTDAANNVSNVCSFTVTITDNENPVAVCKNINVALDLISGTKTIAPSEIDNGSYDNCGTISHSIDKSIFTCSDFGPNNVTLTVTDAAGNMSECTAVVNVGYALVPNPVVSPATDNYCNGEITNLILTNVLSTSWRWTVTAPPQIAGWSDDLSGTKTSIQQTLINSGSIAYKVVYTIIPWLYNTCELPPITAEVWVEPTPQATINTTTPIVCNGSNINVTVNSPTVTTTPANLTYVVTVSSTNAGSLGGTASTDLTIMKAYLPFSIAGTLTNSSDTPIDVTFTVTPKLNSCSDGPLKSVTITVNPTPRAVPIVPAPEICNEGTTSITLGSPSRFTSGVTTFNYTAVAAAGVTGLTPSGNGLAKNYLIADKLSNSTISPQTVTYTIIPLSPTGCANGPGVNVVITVHPKTIQYDYPGTEVGNSNNLGDGILITKEFECGGGSFASLKVITSIGAGPYKFAWTRKTGDTTFVDNNPELVIQYSGRWDVIVTDNLGCKNSSLQWIEPAVVFISSLNAIVDSTTCNGSNDGKISVSENTGSYGNPPFKYWIVRNSQDTSVAIIRGTLSAKGVVKEWAGLPPGNYKLYLRDRDGCFNTTYPEVDIFEPDIIKVTIDPPVNETCKKNDGSVKVKTVSGGNGPPYFYKWFNDSGLTDAIPGQTSGSLTGLAAGRYYLKITDKKGCFLIDSVNINPPAPLTYSITPSLYNGYNISCHGSSNGSLRVNLTSGTAPYHYTLTKPGGSTLESDINEFLNLSAGQYYLSVLDDKQCKANDTITLTEPGKLSMKFSLSASVAGGFNINCPGDSTGSIVVDPVNQVGTVSYLWADGNTGKTLSNLPAGIFSIRITDGNSCIADSSVTLTVAETMKLLFDNLHEPFCPDKPDGEIGLIITGGVRGTDYTYRWSDNSSGSSLSNIPAGLYTVTVWDQNGCYVSDSVQIESLNETCLVIPNIISPNDDGINDVWNIGLIELYPKIEIKIFNRWGETIWKSDKGYTRPWDGTSNGSPLPVDSYHYIIDLHNGSKLFIGNVTIVR
jgi:gliding motility-associated-like protein